LIGLLVKALYRPCNICNDLMLTALPKDASGRESTLPDKPA